MSSIVDRFAELDKSLEKIKKLSILVIKPEDNPDVVVGMFKCDGYSISELMSHKETKLEFHSHDQTEIIVVLEGEIIVELEQDSHTLNVHDSIIIHRGSSHRILYLGTGRILSVMAPLERIIPNG